MNHDTVLLGSGRINGTWWSPRDFRRKTTLVAVLAGASRWILPFSPTTIPQAFVRLVVSLINDCGASLFTGSAATGRVLDEGKQRADLARASYSLHGSWVIALAWTFRRDCPRGSPGGFFFFYVTA